MISKRGELFTRYKNNPILTAADMPVEVNAVFNSGAIKLKDGGYAMMLRIEDLDRKQHFRMSYSEDGIHWKTDAKEVKFIGDEELREYNAFYYDPRLTYIKEDDMYYINFAVHSDRWGVRGGQIKTKDFQEFHWIGFASTPDCRNCVLFPEKINGEYVRIDRPHGMDGKRKNIWISYSKDMIYWGKSKPLMETRLHWWDDDYVGPGTVPIKTDRGWLMIYHGAYSSCTGPIYRLGVALLDLNNPSKLIGRCNGYALGPRELYERVGDVPNVVFACGSIVEDDGTVKLYYGGADTVMCLATAKLTDLLDACKEETC